MKKTLLLSTLSAIAFMITITTLFADDLEGDIDPAHAAYIAQGLAQWKEITQKALTDDEALKTFIRGCFDLEFYTGSDLPSIYDCAKSLSQSEIARERLIGMLETMIREALIAFEKSDKSYPTAGHDVLNFLSTLENFSDYDALPLVKECLRSKSEIVRGYGAKTYAVIKGAKAFPFLHEAIEKGDLPEESRATLYWYLGHDFIVRLKREKRTDVANQFCAFLKEMAQTEQSVNNARGLDLILYANAENYKDSSQRTNILNRIKQMEQQAEQPVE